MNELTSVEDFETVLEASRKGPVFIFKHSTTCPISASAHRRVSEYVKAMGDQCAPFHMVKVIESRPISNTIAERLSVRHASPQLILIDKAEAAWDASHGRIMGPAIEAALGKPA